MTSCNLDRRSFDLNFEAGVLVFDDNFASNLRFLQKSYMERSVPVRLEEWNQRSQWRNICQNAAGLLSPLL